MNDRPVSSGVIAAGQPGSLADLLAFQPHSIASRVIARAAGGSVTLFSIDAGEGLSEHSSPFDALAILLEGRMTIRVGDASVDVQRGQVLLMPARVPHALHAEEPSRMLLVMLR